MFPYLSVSSLFIYLPLSLSLSQSLSILANTHVLIKSLPVSLLASLSLSLPHTLTFTFSYFIITIYCSCNLGIWSRQYSHHLDNPTIREFKTEECLSTTWRENKIVANHFRLNHHNDSPGWPLNSESSFFYIFFILFIFNCSLSGKILHLIT